MGVNDGKLSGPLQQPAKRLFIILAVLTAQQQNGKTKINCSQFCALKK
jgi:hypothetical protein